MCLFLLFCYVLLKVLWRYFTCFLEFFGVLLEVIRKERRGVEVRKSFFAVENVVSLVFICFVFNCLLVPSFFF